MALRTRRLVGLSVPLLLAAACSSTRTIESASAPSISVVDTTADPTADTAVDTVPTSTPVVTDPAVTDPPATVPGPALVLGIDGLELVSFGAGQADVFDALSARLGPTISDEFLDFPVDNGLGIFESVDGDLGFIFQSARLSCFVNDLCVTFGGATAETATFVGWTFRGLPDPVAPTTAAGVTLGTRPSDLPGEITVFEGGCFSVGGGITNDGVVLVLVSDGTPFFEFDALGNPVNQVPDPSEISVVGMESGTQILELFGDC